MIRTLCESYIRIVLKTQRDVVRAQSDYAYDGEHGEGFSRPTELLAQLYSQGDH
jgi:hypothetical protein